MPRPRHNLIVTMIDAVQIKKKKTFTCLTSTLCTIQNLHVKDVCWRTQVHGPYCRGRFGMDAALISGGQNPIHGKWTFSSPHGVLPRTSIRSKVWRCFIHWTKKMYILSIFICVLWKRRTRLTPSFMFQQLYLECTCTAIMCGNVVT